MIIWGWRTKGHFLAMLVARCGLQGHTAAHQLVKQQTKFTLFFIPLFPISTKHLLCCSLCGGAAPVQKDRVPEVLAEAARQEQERTAQQFAEFQAPQAAVEGGYAPN